ncbi:hypothetical protein SYJ56_24745 [Algoriphagus sp. D3-2-R+10]|uniref:hypothetical protein n=1 Tax=Algoriphagus aurantiacus TaxID=3103948 RepID=UPI002B3FB541|nr:hypothetical protein [Algoriphagus sp. D3-2-R+10]MEB2778541.1 hypothetical protein [Algoriphagus sp. D3-2-R+10]
MKLKKVIENALDMLEKADDGIVLMNMYNEVVHPADAAFRGETVHPYNAKAFIEEFLSMNGLDLRDKDLRMKLLKLILEEAEANKSRKKKLDAVLKGYDMESFGKIV